MVEVATVGDSNDPHRFQRKLQESEQVDKTGTKAVDRSEEEVRHTKLGATRRVQCRKQDEVSDSPSRKGVSSSGWLCEYEGEQGDLRFGVAELDIDGAQEMTDEGVHGETAKTFVFEPESECSIERSPYDLADQRPRKLVCPSGKGEDTRGWDY